MMEERTELRELAAEARSYFEVAERLNGSKFWREKDGSPEWIDALIDAAHIDSTGDEMSRDDWRYSFIIDSLKALEENENPDDIYIQSDYQQSVLCEWLGSHGWRYWYTDTAVEEFGIENAHGMTGVIGQIATGQEAEKREVLENVRSFLENRLD
jgi:hypothetical protein